MSLLGDDGLGYELARKLETCGVWRTWLGESHYVNFVQSLLSPATWESFMRADESKSRAQIQLQLRARALLFDKASVSLFLRSVPSSSSSSGLAVSKLNPNYLKLHGDDVYFTLENRASEGGQQRENVAATTNTARPKIQSKAGFNAGSRYIESEFDNTSKRFVHDELPETWYNQFIEKYRASKPYSLSFVDQESKKRTPEEMGAYLKLVQKYKRRRTAIKEDQYMVYGNSVLDVDSSTDDDTPFFPETMFALNCVPDSALPPTNRVEDNQKIEFHGVFDTLPQVMTRSPVMIERLGIRPEYLSMEQRGGLSGRHGSGGKRKYLGQEQASQMSQKVIARLLASGGFDGATEVPLEVFSELLTCHISKLGRILKVLADSYRKQCSPNELLKMFLKKAGFSNVGVLAEYVKDGTRNSLQQPNLLQQTQQQMNGMQSQLQSQHQNPLLLPQQIPRQMHPQMQQMVHPQNLTFQQQQQLERMRRRQPSTPRPVMDMDKDRPMVQVKIETPSELPMDGNAFNTINSRHPQMQQFRQQQQQFAALSNFHSQSGGPHRQLANLQIPQIQNQNMGLVRAPPVKVEGFQELMGGDASLKLDSEENKLTSPSSK